ncbi:MAG: heavy-metal-associated protein [Ferruginibacter sp.]|nr:heavy-metal-associated protein [Ferruginibacter sp.]
MKKILLIIAIAVSATTNAQVKTVSLQASGLTCSMCSNSINKALKTLDFVLKVDADIKTYTFEISFNPNSVIDFDMLRKRVEGAGFSVCGFIANIHFDKLEVKNNQPLLYENRIFLFTDLSEQTLSGEKHVKILDKGFVSTKEYKMHPSLVSLSQTYHVTIVP